jgi:hypothetical protein
MSWPLDGRLWEKCHEAAHSDDNCDFGGMLGGASTGASFCESPQGTVKYTNKCGLSCTRPAS